MKSLLKRKADKSVKSAKTSKPNKDSQDGGINSPSLQGVYLYPCVKKIQCIRMCW